MLGDTINGTVQGNRTQRNSNPFAGDTISTVVRLDDGIEVLVYYSDDYKPGDRLVLKYAGSAYLVMGKLPF
jgi:hypothetical protein